MSDQGSPDSGARKNRNLSDELIALGQNAAPSPERATPPTSPGDNGRQRALSLGGKPNRSSVFNGIAILALALAFTGTILLSRVALELEDLQTSLMITHDRSTKTETELNQATRTLKNTLDDFGSRFEQLESQLALITKRLDDRDIPDNNRLVETGDKKAPHDTEKASPGKASGIQDTSAINHTPKTRPVTIEKSFHWFVNLGTFSSITEAGRFKNKALSSHPDLEIVPVKIDQATMYRVRTRGLPTKQQAETLAQQLQAALQLSGVWVAQASD